MKLGIKASKTIFSIVQLVLCIIIAIILLYPLLWMIGASFKTNEEIFVNHSILPSGEWVLDSFARGWKGVGRTTFTTFIKNSILIAVPAVILTIVSTTLTAYGFARFKFKGKNVLFMVMLSMLMLPNAVIMVPTFILYKDLGWLNSYKPIIVPTAFAINSFLIFMMVQFMRSIPKDFDESATVDGCNSLQTLALIITPMCLPAMISCGLFEFMWKWNDYFNPMLYVNSAKKFTVTLGLRASFDSSTGVMWNQVMAMSFVSIIPCIIVFFCLQKYFVDGIAAGGIKG